MGGRGEGRGEGEEVAEEGRNRMALQCGVRDPGAVDEAGEHRRVGGGGGSHGHGRWPATAVATWDLGEVERRREEGG